MVPGNITIVHSNIPKQGKKIVKSMVNITEEKRPTHHQNDHDSRESYPEPSNTTPT